MTELDVGKKELTISVTGLPITKHFDVSWTSACVFKANRQQTKMTASTIVKATRVACCKIEIVECLYLMKCKSKAKKSISKKLVTFLRWGKSDAIGHHVDDFDGINIFAKN